jgi:predicted DNA-binding protein
MRSTHNSPLKVSEDTKEKVRLIAAITGRPQAEIVGEAIGQFVERHAEDFALGLKKAREALLGTEIPAVAYLLDEDPEKVARVTGAAAEPLKK